MIDKARIKNIKIKKTNILAIDDKKTRNGGPEGRNPRSVKSKKLKANKKELTKTFPKDGGLRGLIFIYARLRQK